LLDTLKSKFASSASATLAKDFEAKNIYHTLDGQQCIHFDTMTNYSKKKTRKQKNLEN
jgi:hypothetical protein